MKIEELETLLAGADVTCNKIAEIVGQGPGHRDLVEAVQSRITELEAVIASERRIAARAQDALEKEQNLNSAARRELTKLGWTWDYVVGWRAPASK